MKVVLSITVGLSLMPCVSAQEDQGTSEPREQIVAVEGPGIEHRLYGVTSWDLGGVGFRVTEHDGKNEFLDAEGKVIHTIAQPSYVDAAVTSPSGACVVFVVQSFRDGTYLLRAKAVKGKVTFESFMKEDSDIIPGRKWSIMEVGAVSDDGNTIVADIAERERLLFMYRWQTWRLQPAERLGTGLTVEKVRKPGMRAPQEGPTGEISLEQRQRKARPHPTFLDARTPELVDYLDGVKPWNHGGGVTSRFDIRGSTLNLMDGSGSVMYSYDINSGSDFDMRVVSSDSGSCLLFSLTHSNWTGSLVRLMPVEGKLRVEELWKKPFDLFSGKKWFIADIGAVSDDGSKALLQIGKEGPDERMLYGWQTWRLDPAECVTPRMNVANGLTFGSGQYGPGGTNKREK
ncbi:MAG: hypothetical protein EOP88_13785 [Verrucomicrobiaceae bacterium]|nr:MAG: hypothetical protein EOP88_13785 [Verrucomicrobiaceae bacterium]